MMPTLLPKVVEFVKGKRAWEATAGDSLFPAFVALAALALAGCAGDQANSSTAGSLPKTPSLNQLIDTYSKPELLYGKARTADGTPIIDEPSMEAKKWLHVDYPKLICASARGDSRALEKLMTLEMDGEAAEAHAFNLLALLEGLGDQRFAAALQRCPAKVQASVREELEIGSDGDDKKFHAKYPATFSKGG